MKKLLLMPCLLLLISDFGYAANRKIYINFDNQPSINATTGVLTDINTAPPQGVVSVLYWGGRGYPAVLGTKSKYVTGRGGTGYALSGIIGGNGIGSWPYIEWQVDENVPSMPEIYVSFWMKYQSYKVETSYKPYQNIKLFYWKFTPSFDSSLMGEIAVGTAPQGDPPTYNEYTLSWRGAAPYSENLSSGFPSFNDGDGNWHHYEFHLNRAAGRARWWIDGKQIWDTLNNGWSGYGDLGTSPYYIAWMHIAGSLIGTGPDSYGTRVFDDIEVWDGMPGTTSNSSPLPSTSPKAPTPPMRLIIQ